LSLYLVPVVLGVFGILFARGLDSPVLRGIALLVSVAGPLLAAVYILLNLTSRGLERILLMGGILLLMMGALATASNVSGVLGAENVSQEVYRLSQWIGLVSLLLGMLALLATTVRTDEAVEEIGARFRHLADQMGEGFVLSSSDGTIVLINQRLLEQTGMSQKDVLGRNVREIAEILDSENILPKIAEMPQGLADEYNCTWTLNGEQRHFLLSRKPLHNRRGRLAGTLATVRDITEQYNLSKRLERYTHGLQKLVEDRTQKLRQSEEQFRELLLSMSEGFLTVDANFRIRFVNDRMCQVLRLNSSALIGREVFDFVDASGRGRLLDLFEAARAGVAQRMQQEFVFVSEGTEVPAMVAVAPVVEVSDAADEDPASSPRYSLVVTDITELKRMQRQLEMRANELQSANDELKMLDRAKDGFLSNVTHELKTPLATIRGYVEMLEGGGLGELQPAQVNALNVMERNAQRLGMLIEEMIEFSRMQIRGIQLSLSLFSVRSLVLDSVNSVRPQSSPKNLTIDTSFDTGATVVWADRKRVAQVLSILLSNAVKFSHPEGRIEITATRRDDNTLELAIRDHGIGIPAAFQERVFDKFFQVDSSHTRRYEGTGIGLSIAKSIAEAHGGGIELQSQPQTGSTFTLVLPHALFDLEYEEDDERLRGLTVVLADDEEESRKALQGVLAQAGCDVVCVRSGYECLRMAREMAPRVILLSEMLPDLTGPATFVKVREEPLLSESAVVLLGGRGTSQSNELGMEDLEYLPKPFDAPELLAKIREVCFFVAPPVAKIRVPSADPKPGAQTSVLVIDPDLDFLAWIEMGLRHRHIDCLGVVDVNEAVGVAGASKPDVIFLGMDSVSGAGEALVRLREAQATREIPVYVLTGLPIEYYEKMDVAGALRKPFSLSDVVDIVLGLKVYSE
jgi:PAS domain S-box-containing protein